MAAVFWFLKRPRPIKEHDPFAWALYRETAGPGHFTHGSYYPVGPDIAN